jgi:preprotein translocase subunit SecF
MFKRILSVALVAALLSVVGPAPARAAASKSKAEKEAVFVARLKEGVAKLGTGTAARVEVKLKDKTKLKGYVSEVGDEAFTVVDAKTGTSTRVAYPQVQKVKGHNLSTGAKVAIGLGAVVAVLVIWLIFENYG